MTTARRGVGGGGAAGCRARHRTALVLALLAGFAVTGCAAGGSDAGEPDPRASAPVSTTPSAAGPSAEPSAGAGEGPGAEASVDTNAVLTDLRAVSEAVTAVTDRGGGALSIATDLAPVAGAAGSAATAMQLCERAVERVAGQGVRAVEILDADGAVIVVYGDPDYGDLCTEPTTEPITEAETGSD